MAREKPESLGDIQIIYVTSDTRLIGVVPKPVINELKERLIFLNPEYEEKQKKGYSTYGIPKYLQFIYQKNDEWLIPRGFTREIIEVFKKHRCAFILNLDNTRTLENVEFQFHGKLRKDQEVAQSKILQKYFGVVQMPTGIGKTVVALACIAERQQPALVIVHRKELLDQWRDEAKKFLKLEDDEIGLIGGGHKKIGKKLTIAIINTLRKMTPEVKEKIGFLIVDECHKVPANTFYDTVSQFDCRYMLGMSATAYRNDGLTDLIYFSLGRLVYEHRSKDAQAQGLIMKPRVILRPTGIKYKFRGDYTKLITDLTHDGKRNNLIVDDAISRAYNNPGTVLLTSKRREHCVKLAELINNHEIVTADFLTGNLTGKKRKQIVDSLKSDEIAVLVATTDIIKEGFDYENFTSLIMATPIKTKNNLIQLIGRIRRTGKNDGKIQPVIYDYIDKGRVFEKQYKSRLQAYDNENITFGV